MRPDTTQLGPPDLSERPFYFVLPNGRVEPNRLPTVACLVNWLARQPAGTRGFRRGCFGPVAETCAGGRVRLFTDVDAIVRHVNRKREG